MQARVLKLKSQLNKVVFRNARKLSLFTPLDLPTGLSAVDSYCDEPQIENVSQIVEVLIDNQAVEEELQNFEKVSQPVEKPVELVKENPEKESITSLVLAPLETVLEPKPDCTPETVPAPGKSSLRQYFASEFLVPKNKRMRADRRAVLGGWNVEKIRNLRSTGEPDKQ